MLHSLTCFMHTPPCLWCWPSKKHGTLIFPVFCYCFQTSMWSFYVVHIVWLNRKMSLLTRTFMFALKTISAEHFTVEHGICMAKHGIYVCSSLIEEGHPGGTLGMPEHETKAPATFSAQEIWDFAVGCHMKHRDRKGLHSFSRTSFTPLFLLRDM